MSSEFVTLNNGRKMPIIGLGTAFGFDDVIHNVMREALNTALKCGYRAIDTAYLYQNEEAIGDELHEWFSQGKIKREDLFVTTKLPAIGNRAELVDKFLTLSLQKLKLDYLDLYLIHHPFGLKYIDDETTKTPKGDGECQFDYETNLESLWRALEKEVDAGRVKAIGLSNFNSKQIDRILKVARIHPAVNQVEMHAYLPQQPLVEFCKQRGIVVTAFSPMGAPYTKEGFTASLLQNPTVLEIGKKHGKTAGQVLIRYLIQLNVTVVPKSVKPERIVSNFQVMDFELTKDDMQKLKKLNRGKDGRVFDFQDSLNFPGCAKHKEYPFHEEF